MGTTLQELIRFAAREAVATFPDQAQLVRDDEAFYRGPTSLCAQMCIMLGEQLGVVLPRDDRLAFLGYVFGVDNLDSMKSLTVAQMSTLIAYAEFAKALYDEWRTATVAVH